jgi:hypothetical protein
VEVAEWFLRAGHAVNRREINMKRFLFVAVVVAIAVPALVADAGVSIQVGEPGFYGSIDIGGFPQPQLIYSQPVVIERVPVGVVREPIYLYVPPGHAKNWSKHCRKYNACGQPVYFVQEGWYNQEYVPRYRESHGGGHGQGPGNNQGNGHGKGHGKAHGHDDD